MRVPHVEKLFYQLNILPLLIHPILIENEVFYFRLEADNLAFDINITF